MIPKPTTRNQARANAILAAEEAHTTMRSDQLSQRWSAVSRAWSDIAQTFPYDEIDVDEEYNPNTRPMMLTPTERDLVGDIREGSAVVVHPDYITEHRDLMDRQFTVEPGYVGMAVTPEEQRQVMAMRSGAPTIVMPGTTQTLPVIQDSATVFMAADFHAVVMTIVMRALDSNLADGGVATVYPEDISSARTRSAVMATRPGPCWQVWLEESGA